MLRQWRDTQGLKLSWTTYTGWKIKDTNLQLCQGESVEKTEGSERAKSVTSREGGANQSRGAGNTQLHHGVLSATRLDIQPNREYDSQVFMEGVCRK